MTIQVPELEEIQKRNQTAAIARAERDTKRKQETRSIFKSLIPSIGAGLFDFFGNSILQDKAQHYYKENQQQLFNLQQRAEKNAASNEVEGLRRAGLSTAMAGSGSPMSVGAVSSPSASTHTPSPAPEYGKLSAENSLMRKQEGLLDAEINLKNAQAQGVALQNKDTAASQGVAAQAWSATLLGMAERADEVGKTEDGDFLRELANLGDELKTSGSLVTLVQMINSVPSYAGAYSEARSFVLDSKVFDKQLDDPNLLKELAIAPYLKNNVLRGQFKELVAMSAKLYSDKEVNGELVRNIHHQYDEITANIKKLNADADFIKHNDLVGAEITGDEDIIRAHVINGVGRTLQNVAGLAPFAARGLASAPAAAPARGAAAPAAPAKTAVPVKPSRDVYAPNAVGGEARKNMEAAEHKKADKVLQDFYKDYKKSQKRYHRENDDLKKPRRKPKHDAWGNPI